MGGRGGERGGREGGREGGGREGDAKSLIQPLTLVNMASTKVILEIKEFAPKVPWETKTFPVTFWLPMTNQVPQQQL